MNYTTQKGLLTEIQCQKDFSERGILLSQPIINDSRYDYLADINKKIYKIQCKSASPVAEDNRAFSFATFSFLPVAAFSTFPAPLVIVGLSSAEYLPLYNLSAKV